jgi:hypothetical protein
VRALTATLRTVGGADPSAEDRSLQFSLFAFLLALAILFHQARLGDWEVLSAHLAVSLSAIFVLLRPSSVPRLLAMLAIQLVSMAIDMPLVVNHWLLLGLTTIGLGVALGVAAIRRRPWLSDSGEIYRRIAPAVRIQVVLVYLFAVLAKLNTDFLDPALSCASQMSQDLLTGVPLGLYAGWQDGPAIAGTLLIEALLPLGLLMRRTRVAAVIAGGTFHTVLAVAGHIPFSGFAFAFYALFLPDDLPQRARTLLAQSPRLREVASRAGRAAASRAAFPVLGGAWVLTAAGWTYGPDAISVGLARGSVVLFVAYATILGLILALCLRQGGPGAYGPGPFRLAHPIWAIAPVLVVLNAATPYLGLKTQSAFTMYSNLQTEKGHWNHVLVPEAVRVFDLQDDSVEIVRSNDERLAQAARDGTRYVPRELRRYVRERPGVRVSFRRAGEPVRTLKADGAAPPLLERKLLLFRDIPVTERNTCRNRRSAGPDQGS